MKPDAVLFDCDGVIVDSEPATFALIRQDLADHGLDLTIAELEHLVMGGTIEAIPEISAGMGHPLPARWSEEFYDRLCAHLARGTPLIPGIGAVFDALDAAGVPYAVGSNGRRVKMEATLGQHPALWARLHDRLFSGRDLGCPKPAPDLYLTAARWLGADPARCVVIEDSATGARAGIAAGMRVLGYASQGANPRLAAVGAEIFTDMAQMPGLLRL